MVNIKIRLSTFFVVKDGEALYSKQKQDLELTVAQIHQLLIGKSRLKLKKAEKTNRPVRYKLNQIPYKYTLEMTNRFKGLNLVNRVPEELWTEVHNIVQEILNKTIPKKKKCKKAKWLSEEALQIATTKKRSENQGRKRKVYLTECRVPENSKERQEGLLQ